ncbi:hypothetical protein H4R20_005867 [Coemansia guatemalensis]|uniref:UPF3 domain-containing protein n=1 Tax=Coemansia guatemalensis TaxID=2761395 RepID=A0A9W8HTE8_9FUNG|nr:hypothetical protein H4R20_005867 [Coemansia guatemalensis]
MSTEDQALPPKRDNEPLVTRPGGRAPRNRPKPAGAPANRNSPAATAESADAPKKPRRRGPKPSAPLPNNGSRNGSEAADNPRPRPAKPNAAAAASSPAKGKGVKPPAHVPDSSNAGAGGSAQKQRSKPNKPRPAPSAAQVPPTEDAAAEKPRGQARPRRKQNSGKPGPASPAASASTAVPTKQPPAPKILQRNPPKPKEQPRQQPRAQPKPKPTPKPVAKPKTKLSAEPSSPAVPTATVASVATVEAQTAAVADTLVAAAERPASRPPPAPRSKPAHRSVKLCIRWLPADLPEHVFWRAIEPSLPWFDAASIGSVVQRKRFVLTALLPGHDQSQSDADGLKATEPTEEDEGSEDTMTPQEHIATEGATTAVPQSFYESENLARLDCAPYWRRFVAGKQHASKAKPVEPSCAYIAFASDAEAGHFYRRFHGHVFGREGGVQWRARVELTAFQSLPVGEHAVPDPLEDTIDADPDFMAFLDPRVQQKPPQHASYAAAVGGSEEKVTPLIKYLRELKAKKNLPQSKAAGKKAKPAPPQQQQQKESTKKQRRRNR